MTRFRDAELLAYAVASGLRGERRLDKAFAKYHKERDRATTPMDDFTAQLAQLEAPSKGENSLFQALSQTQEDTSFFLGVLTGAVPIQQLMSPRTVIRLIGIRGLAQLIAGQARRDRSSHDAAAAAPVQRSPH